MSWTYIIQQKIKMAFLLAGIMALIVITSMVERRHIDDMNKSFISIYNDRLIPATDIFYLMENLYSKRLLMEKHLLEENNEVGNLREQFNMYDKNINTLILKYEKTYLVDLESKYLEEFKKKVKAYAAIEQSIITLIETGEKKAAVTLYENEGKVIIKSTINHLHNLTEIQSVVGEELIKDSKEIIASSNMMSSLQIILAIIIGAIIQALIFTSKIVNKKSRDFNLN